MKLILDARIAPTQGADGESLRPVAWQYKVAGRIELHSHQLDHFYFINGSYVKGTPLYAARDAAPSDAQDAERAAKAWERKRCDQYEWTDDEFEIWWNKDDRCKRAERIAEAQFILDAAIAPREEA